MNSKLVEKKAMQVFGPNGLFCAESVLTAVADEAGVTSPLIPRIATGFCGGIARSCGMCGAVSGGIMALGLLHGRDHGDETYETVYDQVQIFLRAFKEAFGSIDCFELTGFDLGKASDRQAFAEKGVMKKCRRFTGKAAGLVAEIIANADSRSNTP
jgi:C_GCAxxG_C_C family probable redox protein